MSKNWIILFNFSMITRRAYCVLLTCCSSDVDNSSGTGGQTQKKRPTRLATSN